MKYRIEIWQYHNMTESYESDNIDNVLQWYKVNWRCCYELDGCTFYLYKDGIELSWNEEYRLGFHA